MKACPVCEKELVERNGKFGPFICCPAGKHGTFSIQGSIMYFTGEVGAMLKRARVQEVYDRLALEHIECGVSFQPTISQLMNAQMAQFGWNSSDEMTQLAEFAVGNPDEMWDDREKEDESVWWNQRPY
jgi:hypothetical protein